MLLNIDKHKAQFISCLKPGDCFRYPNDIANYYMVTNECDGNNRTIVNLHSGYTAKAAHATRIVQVDVTGIVK